MGVILHVCRLGSTIRATGATDERPRPLDYEVRVILAQRLRTYYDHIRQVPVSEALSNLLKEIEPKT